MHTETVVIGGVDAHTDTHQAAALDDRGALLGTETFARAAERSKRFSTLYDAIFIPIPAFGRLQR
ncbi:MAG TPA: hypothetical protein VF526_17690, partial [Solirubrobacteraceae bacterium]